jgi:hypothetical protein
MIAQFRAPGRQAVPRQPTPGDEDNVEQREMP